MNAKLIVNNVTIDIEITEEQLRSFTPVKKTGYERVAKGDVYYHIVGEHLDMFTERNSWVDDQHFEEGNYINNEALAKNIIRATRLMRQLRSFAVKHRVKPIDWNDNSSDKFCINFLHLEGGFEIVTHLSTHDLGQIYFDTYETAQLAILTFKDELKWYFTEYHDGLQEG